MSEFLPAFEFMVVHEGGYNFVHGDAGGKTKFGISQRSYPTLDIEGLTLEDAQEIYERDYWSNAYAKIESQAVANKVFDMAVNMGHSQAHKITQRACLDCGHTVSVDGFLGEKTLAAVNSIPETNLLMAIKARAGSFYRDLAASKPSNVQFLKGWLARANA
jgi:lysozyme family protein